MSFYEYLLVDLETNGLTPDVIWMAGAQNVLTKEYRSFIGSDQLADLFYELGTNTKIVIGHNFRKYDKKVMQDLSGVEIDDDIVIDTLELSRHLFPNRPKHSLGSWGVDMLLPKMKAPRFDRFTPEMVQYCERDVRLNTTVFEHQLNIFWERYFGRLDSIPSNMQMLIEYTEVKYEHDVGRQILMEGQK